MDMGHQIMEPSEFSVECRLMNTSIAGKYGTVLRLLNGAIHQALPGLSLELNWRYTDMNLFLNEIGMFTYGSKDWYNLTQSEIDLFCKRCSQKGVQELLVLILKSVIEPFDIQLSLLANNAGFDAEEAGRFKEAEKNYCESLSLDPNSEAALFNYGDFLLNRVSNLSLAKAIVDKLLLLYPNFARGYGLAAMIEDTAGRKVEALVLLERVNEFDRTSAIRSFNHAKILVETGNFVRASTIFEQAILLDPNNGAMIGEYADCLFSRKMYKESALAFERALALEPNNSTVLNDYSVLMHKIAKKTKNVDDLKKAELLIARVNFSAPCLNSFISYANAKSLELRHCGLCGKVASTTCGACGIIKYCNAVCQKKHWKVHKLECKNSIKK